LMATILYRASSDKMQPNDHARVQVLDAINEFRRNVEPPAADMLVIVSQCQVTAVWTFSFIILFIHFIVRSISQYDISSALLLLLGHHFSV